MRNAAIAAIFGVFGSVLGLSVLGSMQAQAAGNRLARQNYQTAGGGGAFTGGTVPDATTFQSAVTMDTTLAVTGVSTFTGQIEANGNIKLLANRDLTCASLNSCEVGSSTNYMKRGFFNDFDVAVLRARASGTALLITEPDGVTVTGLVQILNGLSNSGVTNDCTANDQSLCAKDDMVVDGYFAIEESTIPTVPLNYGAFWFADDNTAHVITGDGVDHMISLVETFHAESTDANNTDVFGISAALNFECYHTNGLVAGDLAGFTFDAGGAGTPVPIESIADGGGGEIAVTTTGSHGLAVGDIVSQANLTDAAYEGFFRVNTVTSATVFEVTAVFTATDTGTLNQCASLIASAGSAGDYFVTWTASATSSTNNETFDLELFIEAAGDNTTEVRDKFGTGGDFENIGNSAIITIADGDHVSLGIENQDTAGDITIRYLTIVMMRL